MLPEIFPRKASMDAEHCGDVTAEIAAFWRFVDRIHDVEAASEIAETVERLTVRFRKAMSDSSNFGMAKNMFILGDQAGYDMAPQEGLEEYMMAYNEPSRFEHLPEETVPPPMSAEEKRVDRKQRKKLLAAKQKKKR